MSKLLTFAGCLLLVLVIGVAASNSNTAPQTTTPTRVSVKFKEFLDSLKSKPTGTVKFQRASDKGSINAAITDVYSDYLWIDATAPPPSGRGTTVSFYYVPFSSIPYIQQEATPTGVQVFTVGLEIK
jgi:hypothetical protein